MTLNKLVSSLFLAAALSLGSCGADESTSVQCKQGRVPYQGQCCPDDNSNGICDWIEGDAIVGHDIQEDAAVKSDLPGVAADTAAGSETSGGNNSGKLAYIEDQQILVSVDENGNNRKELYFAGIGKTIQTPEWRSASDIYFVLVENGKRDILHLDLSSGQTENITNTPNVSEQDPSIQGQYMVYASDEQGSLDIWLMDLSNGQKKRLTSGPEQEYQPALAKDLNRIVFVTNDGETTRFSSVNLSGGSLAIWDGTEGQVRPIFGNGNLEPFYLKPVQWGGYDIVGTCVTGLLETEMGQFYSEDSKFGIHQTGPCEYTIFYVNNGDIRSVQEWYYSQKPIVTTPFVTESDVTVLNK